MFHYTELCFMYIVTSFLCFTTHSCTSCTLSPLFYASLHTAVLHIQKRGDNVHEVQLCVVKYKKRGDNVHEVQLCVDIVTSFLYFTTQSCTSCTLSHLFFCLTTHSCTSYILSPLFNVSLQTCTVVKHKKEVTMYMKYSCVQ
jgi:hypothetical protein